MQRTPSRMPGAILSVSIAFGIVLGACGGASTVTVSSGTPVVNPTAAPTAVPTATPVPHATVIGVFSSALAIPFNGTGTMSVSCPSGAVLVSGGYIVRYDSQSDNGLPPTDSYPSSANVWTVALTQSANGALHMTAIATCVQANFTISTQIVQSSATTAGITNVGCPSGTVLTGGGFRSGGGYHNASRPNGNGWQVLTSIPFGGTASPTAYAICATRGLKSASTLTASKTVTAGATDGDGITCPSGKLPVGGGHNGYEQGSDTFWHVFLDGPDTGQGTTSDGWQNEVHSGEYGPYTLTTYAVCDTY